MDICEQADDRVDKQSGSDGGVGAFESGAERQPKQRIRVNRSYDNERGVEMRGAFFGGLVNAAEEQPKSSECQCHYRQNKEIAVHDGFVPRVGFDTVH